jgi:phage repressor protein C with HTH and peptisase S24 domain
MANINKELVKYFENKGFTQQMIAEKLHVSKAYINALFTGKSSFGKKQAERWSDEFGISQSFLLTGEGNIDDPKRNHKSDIETRPRIPTTVAAGTLTGFAESIKSYNCENIPVIKALPDYDYTIIVKGDSMEPHYAGGDEIAIRKVTDHYIEWGKVYVLDTRDGAVIKRLYQDTNGFRCVSYNKDYPDFIVNRSEVFGIYKVVGLIRIE